MSWVGSPGGSCHWVRQSLQLQWATRRGPGGGDAGGDGGVGGRLVHSCRHTVSGCTHSAPPRHCGSTEAVGRGRQWATARPHSVGCSHRSQLRARPAGESPHQHAAWVSPQSAAAGAVVVVAAVAWAPLVARCAVATAGAACEASRAVFRHLQLHLQSQLHLHLLLPLPQSSLLCCCRLRARRRWRPWLRVW